ncbi:MAG: thioredoxin family protein [Oscillospiraceae bacterium]|nr:thioredoxin family protein [Oscillospiraceae bacterium]
MPKHVKMMILESCPFCRQALEIAQTLVAENPEFAAVQIEVIEESREPEKIKGYDYWYVPTYFVDDVKIHEGVPSKEKVRQVFLAALEK